jgi:two-component system chemotaxis response regulator CheB
MGPRVIGVILTGLLDDGAAGLEAIQTRGGATIVQDPADAFARGMPLHASPFADDILPLAGLPRRLIELIDERHDARTTDEAAPHDALERGAPAPHARVPDTTPAGARGRRGTSSR